MPAAQRSAPLAWRPCGRSPTSRKAVSRNGRMIPPIESRWRGGAVPPTPEMLPNLLIPGAMRSGTTAMHTLLAQHPDIYMSSYKEPNVLANPQKDVADYRRLFANAPAARYRGESSTMYMILPEAISKMALLPDLQVDRHAAQSGRSRLVPLLVHQQVQYRAARASATHSWPTSTSRQPSAVHNTNYFQVGLYAKWLGVLEEKIPVERDPGGSVRRLRRRRRRDDCARSPAFLDIPYVRPSGAGRRNESGVMNHTTVLRSYVATTHAVGATVGRVLPSRVYNALSDVNHRTARALYRRSARTTRRSSRTATVSGSLVITGMTWPSCGSGCNGRCRGPISPSRNGVAARSLDGRRSFERSVIDLE